MAKSARFKSGTSGSPKHTEVMGASGYGGGSASAPSERGPRIGPGVLARVRPDYDRDKEGRGGKMRGKMPTYSEE